MIVAAGVSALRPLMEIASDKPENETSGIEHIVDVAALATRGNYVGPLVAAVAFVRVFTFSDEQRHSPPMASRSRFSSPAHLIRRSFS